MGECKATKPDGGPCGSRTRGDEPFCLWHSEERQAEAAAVRALGGANRRVTEKSEYQGEITSVGDLMKTLNAAIADAWAMEPGERRMRSISSLLRIAADCIEIVDTDQRLTVLESLFYATQNKTN